MTKLIDFWKKAWEKTVVQIFSTIFLSLLPFIVALLFSNKLLDFLSTDLTIQVYLFILVAIFSIYGVISFATIIWKSFIHISKNDKSKNKIDQEFELAVEELLDKLIDSETGYTLDSYGIGPDKSAVLFTYEKWEKFITRYTNDKFRDRLDKLREEIKGTYLPQGYIDNKATQMIIEVKNITEKVRTSIK